MTIRLIKSTFLDIWSVWSKKIQKVQSKIQKVGTLRNHSEKQHQAVIE
jgi:hypothetical protein